jgi:hypothetical protein
MQTVINKQKKNREYFKHLDRIKKHDESYG